MCNKYYNKIIDIPNWVLEKTKWCHKCQCLVPSEYQLSSNEHFVSSNNDQKESNSVLNKELKDV